MKKTSLILAFYMLMTHLLFAQKENIISLFGGRTFMGRGDIRGFNLGFGYRYLNDSRLGIEANVRATSATKKYEFTPALTENAKNGYNTEFRSTTSGYQLEVLVSVPLIKKKIMVNLLAGPVFRRQYNTLPNPWGVNYTQDFKTTILNLHYDRPSKTHSAGLSGQLEIAVKFLNKNYLGARLAGHSYSGDLNWYIPLVYQRKL